MDGQRGSSAMEVDQVETQQAVEVMGGSPQGVAEVSMETLRNLNSTSRTAQGTPPTPSTSRGQTPIWKGRSPTNNLNLKRKRQLETVDLESDSSDSDVVCLDDSDDSCDLSGSIKFKTEPDFYWLDTTDYPLYHENEDFKAFAAPFINVVGKEAPGCIQTFERAYKKIPGVDEFWNFLISKYISRSGWEGVWKAVDPERRGWPLQHFNTAQVLVKSTTFYGLSIYIAKIEVVKSFVNTYCVGDQVTGLQLWQLEPLRSQSEPAVDTQAIETEKSYLQIIRKFYETIYVTDGNNSDDITLYFGLEFYERLLLLYYMENPTPYDGMLSLKDRGKIVAGIKQFHFLKNAINESQHRLLTGEVDEEENGEEVEESELKMAKSDGEYCCEKQRIFIMLQMQLDRHKVELNFLLKPSLRPHAGDLLFRSIEDYDYPAIIVIKDANIADFSIIHAELSSIYRESTPRFKILSNLEQVIRNCSYGADIILASGNYSISGLHRLSEGGRLIGIKTGDDEDVTITPTDEVGDVWLLFTGQSGENDTGLIIKNINFVINTNDNEDLITTGLYLTSGKVFIENTTFKNIGVNVSEKNVVIAKKSENAIADLVNCNFTISEAE